MSYTPLSSKDFPTQQIANGSIASFVLYAVSVTGLHRVAVYASPVVANSLATVMVTLTWTDGGVSRTWTSSAMSLVNLTSNILQILLPLRCDAGTNINASITVTGSAGAYNATFGVRPPQ